MKTINLDEILKGSNVSIFFLNGMSIPDGHDGTQGDRIKQSMLEFGKQLLELAAENAEIEQNRNGCRECGAWCVDIKSILDTIKQVESCHTTK